MEKDFKFKAIRVIVVLSVAIVIAVLLIKMQPEPEHKIRTETALLVEALPAKAEYLRQKKLIEKNVVAQTTLDNAEQKYLASLERLQNLQNQLALTGPSKDRLKAQRDMAKVLFRQAELDLEKTSIIAPFDGWVVEKEVEKGQHVIAGQNLGKIYSKGALDIEVNIPIKDLRWLPTDFAEDSMPETEIIFSRNNSVNTWNGRVARVKAKIDGKRSRNVEIRKLEIGNWKFGLHAFVLFFPISNFYFNLSQISTFQFQVSSRERLPI